MVKTLTAAVFSALFAPALAQAQCEPSWLFDQAGKAPLSSVAAGAPDASQAKLSRLKEPAPAFKAEDAKKRFDSAAAKSPSVDQLLGTWMLEARVEGDGAGAYNREGLMNKKGEPGVMFFVSKDNPYAGERKNVLGYVMNVDYANGNAGYDKGYAVTRGDLAAGFVETFNAGTKQETRSYACRLVADDRVLCQVQRSVSILGFSGQYTLDPKGGYTAYYGFLKTRPALR